MDKEDRVRIYNGVLPSYKKNEIMPCAAVWIDLEMSILSEVRQRQILYDTAYRWNNINIICIIQTKLCK